MHFEALSESAKKVWEKCLFLKEDFYLAGGTALAMQIGHRISVDLDFFSPEPIKKNIIPKIESIFETTVTPLVNTKDETTVMVRGVKMTFLHYPFPLLGERIPTYIVSLAGVPDIASMKAYALGRRQSFKDYVDLYFVFKKALVSIEDCIKDSLTKYGDAFNDRLFLEQLLSPDNIDEEEIIWLGDPHSKEEVREFFEDFISNKKFL
jgi:hypothetical protein